MSLATIHRLLEGIIDYAGLFPPASLEMGPAAREFALQRRSRDAWMLGRFVVPVARLDELAAAVSGIGREADPAPWGLSVLAGADPAADRRRIEDFRRAGSSGTSNLRIEAVEHQPATPEHIASAVAAFSGLETYFEISDLDDPRPFFAALAEHGGRAKIRTGGVTAEAFPTSAELARFILAAARSDVPFKATAGLHHPLRGDYRLTYEAESALGTMHGFLNVFLAAAWARSAQASEESLRTLLDERRAEAISFADARIRWGGLDLDLGAIADSRERLAISFGSCSFGEPASDLRQLKLL